MNHFFDFSKLPSKIVNYICECVKLINYVLLEDELHIEIVRESNSKLIIKTYHNRLELNKQIAIRNILDSLIYINNSNILHVITNELPIKVLKLNKEMILQTNENHFKSDYIQNKITEMKEIDLYYDGYHITDIYKRSAIDKQVNKYYNENSFEININWGNIGDSGLEYLSDYICSMTNLNTINLYINNISNSGLYYLCKGLKYTHEIKTINLGGNRISDEGIIELSNKLCYITKLEKLYLMKNRIEDEGILYMCDYLSQLKNLQSLYINHNFISTPGYKCIKERIVDFTQLTVL